MDDEALLRLSCPFGGGLFARCGASLTIGYHGKGIAPKNSPVSYAQARQKLQELIPETTLGDFNEFWAAFHVDALLQLITAFGDEAATAALEQAAQWRPVETAPKDGTQVLLYLVDGQYCCGRWLPSPNGGEWWNALAILKPTHWMPLQPPIAAIGDNKKRDQG